MNTPLQVIFVHPFSFYGNTFSVYQCNDGNIYVPVSSLCDSIGLHVHTQLERIARDGVLSEHLVSLEVPVMDAQGQSQSITTACLRLHLLPYWLITISSNYLREGVRQQVIGYCQDHMIMSTNHHIKKSHFQQ